ncbi:MAG TPA: sigma-54 dependent transcriptional regulator [Polyangiaceae bacterium]|nr:sigma-54 dependent transcriptional regulator [Polyangiaceae bacterium]
MNQSPILLVDGSPRNMQSIESPLRAGGHSLRVAQSAAEALAVLAERPVQAVLTCPRMADSTLSAFVGKILSQWPETPVLVVTDDPSAPDVVDAMHNGAEVLLAPVDDAQLTLALGKASSALARQGETSPRPDATLLGNSALMKDATAILKRAAASSSTVLVRGESGTGKELAARAVHRHSGRSAAPFVKIDCTSLPDNLLESELFGYEKGAFTGATTRKLGRVELANGGTIFFDEVGELTLPLQAKLLRLLQDREIERLGGTKTLHVDVRVVAATHRDLETMIERGLFRQDLFYRLNVVEVWLPPLRARREDIPCLARHFCESFAPQSPNPNAMLDDSALRVLRAQRWPGNVRQLQNLVERLVVMSETPSIGEAAVRAELGKQVRFVTQPGGTSATIGTLTPCAAVENAPGSESRVGPLQAELQAAERAAIVRALRHTGENRTLAARLLGVSRSTLYLKLDEHGLL